jgi:hypothetical protein
VEELVERMLKNKGLGWKNGDGRWDEEELERGDARRGLQGNTYSSP